MDFTTMGTMGNYMKNMSMESKWMESRKKGIYTSKEALAESRMTEYEKNHQKEIESVQEQVDEMNKNKDNDLERIIAKVNNGKELTPMEKEYLKRKSPEVYQEVIETEEAQKCYEEALKNCRTKEDVQRLKNMEMGQRLSAVKSVMNNPNIPESEKLGLVMKEYKKVKAALEVEKKFIESGAYDKLPTDAEYSEAIEEELDINNEETQESQDKQDETVSQSEKEEISEQETKDAGADREELEKEIQQAQNRFESVAKKSKEVGDTSLDAMYAIETIDDLMSFGARFGVTSNPSFEANA